MKDFAIFSLQAEPSNQELKIVEELNLILSKMGCEIKTSKLHDEKRVYHSLIINFDSEAAQEYLSRNAGRPRKQTNPDLTVRDVRQMLQERTAEDVAKELGISRSTLFRRLKKDDEFFF